MCEKPRPAGTGFMEKTPGFFSTFTPLISLPSQPSDQARKNPGHKRQRQQGQTSLPGSDRPATGKTRGPVPPPATTGEPGRVSLKKRPLHRSIQPPQQNSCPFLPWADITGTGRDQAKIHTPSHTHQASSNQPPIPQENGFPFPKKTGHMFFCCFSREEHILTEKTPPNSPCTAYVSRQYIKKVIP